MLTAVPLALAAALCFAVSSVLQQRAAAATSTVAATGIGLLFTLARRPLWLGGIAAAIGSVVLQGVALSRAPLTLVQPLIVLELVFAIPLSAWTYHARLGVREWTGVLAVVAGLGTFLVTAQPGEGSPEPPIVSWLVISAVVALTAGCWVGAARGRAGPRRALLLGIAAGTLFGLQSSLLKTITHVFGRGLAHVLTSWHIYAFAAVAIVGMTCAQSAFQAGPLPFSLPAIDTFEPVVAALIGVVAFGETITTSPPAIAAELVGGAMLATGIVVLDRSPLLLAIQSSATAASAGQRAHPDK